MSAPCSSFREAFLAAAQPQRDRAHGAVCAECERWARALEAREAALGGLARLGAPAELEGAVVAALEAGFRQERAVSALLGLGRVSSPRALDHALQGELASTAPAPTSLPAVGRVRAPSVLDALVSQELCDPAGHRARRFVGSLERLSAPAELAERLAAGGWAAPRARPVRPATLGALALLLAAGAIGLLLRAERPRAPRYDFVVEVVDDPSQFSALGAGLLDGVTGGRVTLARL
jgi:hypothetical protein